MICLFTGGGAWDADGRYSMDLEMPAGIGSFQGLLKPPAKPGVLTFRDWPSVNREEPDRFVR